MVLLHLRRILWTFGLAASLFSGDTAGAKISDSEATYIKGALQSEKVELVDGAIRTIKARMAANHDDAYMCVKFFDVYWHAGLVKQGRYTDIADICRLGMLERFNDTTQMRMLLKHRINALQHLKRHEEALVESKRLFNISRMENAGEALILIAECLNDARPQDKQIGEKFKREQAAAAAKPGVRSPIMDAIKLDDKELQTILDNLKDDDYRAKMGRAILLLMLGQEAAAETMLQKQLDAATDPKEKLRLTADVARAMKAADGAIARANAFVVASKPGR